MVTRHKLSTPPTIKVLEAAGAIGDGRVNIVDDVSDVVRARVASSAGDKVYTVVVRRGDGRVIYSYSDDNGTRYRRYVGYPIISVLMLQGLLPRDPSIERALAGIPWSQWNKTYKSYSITMKKALDYASRLVEPTRIEDYVTETMARLKKYTILYDPGLATR